MADPQIALLLGLLIAIRLVALARRVGVQYPIVLVLGGSRWDSSPVCRDFISK